MTTFHRICAKFFVIILDVILLGFGVALLGVGIWFRVDQRAKDLRDAMDTFLGDDLSNSTSWLIIAIGIAITFIAVCGLIGAIMEIKWLLGLFIFLLLLMVACEVAAVALAALYKESLFDDLRYNMESSRDNMYYDANGTTTEGTGRPWDFVQSTFKCCDVYDYRLNEEEFSDAYDQPFPYSCCKLKQGYNAFQVGEDDVRGLDKCKQADPDFMYSGGCFTELASLAEDNIIILLGIAIAVACFTMFLLIFTICLLVNANPKSEDASE
jgi:hypothetical protein